MTATQLPALRGPIHLDPVTFECEARLNLALENAGMGMWELDLSTGECRCSDRMVALLGLPRDEYPGTFARALELVDEEDREVVSRARDDAAAGMPLDVEFRTTWRDGTVHWIHLKGGLTKTAAGKGSRVIGIGQDITGLKQLMAALKNTQRQKDEVIATIAHELRQPLGAIQAAVAVMRARISRGNGERARAVLERQVEQLSRLIEDLLDASHIVKGTITLRRARTSINDVITAAAAVVQPLIRDREQQLTLQVPDRPLWLDADAQRLQQVFSNLLTNASKFTDTHGQITVTAERASDGVIVRVRDTGRGIAADALHHIFDMFTQATPDERGLGIGLTVVRGLVERHGGSVEARSDGVGKGSEFIVRLPIAA